MASTTRGRPRPAPVLVGVAVGVAVALVVVLVVALRPDRGSSAGPPWSIATEPGAVVVDIARTQDAAGLQRALAGVGVAAQVDFPGPGRRCQIDRYDAVASGGSTLEVGRHVTATLERGDLRAGVTVVLEASLGDSPSAALGFAAGRVAACAPGPATGS